MPVEEEGLEAETGAGMVEDWVEEDWAGVGSEAGWEVDLEAG